MTDPLPFGKILADALEQKGLSQNAFARAADCAISYVTDCVNGKQGPNEGDLDAWATILELKYPEKEAFYRAGRRAKAHMQKAAIPYLRQIEKDYAGIEESLRASEAEVQRLADENAALRTALESRGAPGRPGTPRPRGEP